MADWTASLSGAQRDAAQAVLSLFGSYGLESLAPKIVEFVQQGYAAETVSLLLQDTVEYKKRFAGNAARIKKGLPALSPAEYLAVEKSYRQIMSTAGLPVGFYDQPDDFQKMIEADLAPQEVQNRVQAAADLVNNAPPEAMAAWRSWYTTGDAIAYALDPERASSAIDRAYKAAQIGGQATRQGVDVSRAFAEELAKAGVNQDAASQGFAAVAMERDNAAKLASLEGETLTTTDLARETFLNDSSVAQKRDKLASRERGRFGGSSGVGSLKDTTGGAF